MGIHQFICDGCSEETIAYRPRRPKFCSACTEFRAAASVTSKSRAQKLCKGCGVRMLNVEYGGRWICDECTEVRERRHNGYANPYSSVTRLLVAANDNSPQTKVCTSCECELPLTDFVRHKSGGLGRAGVCIDCSKALRGDRSEEYAKRARPVLTEEQVAQRILTKRIRLIERANRKRVVEKHSLGQKMTRYLRKWRKQQAERDRLHQRRLIIAQKPWLAEGISPYERVKIRKEHDPDFAVRIRLKSRVADQMRLRKRGKCGEAARTIRSALKGAGSIPRFLGYSTEELRRHLEYLFTDGMCWDAFNRGDIHIDHKIPLAHFDLTDEGEVLRAWSLNNLQPLWAKDNLVKGARTDEEWRAAA